MRIGGTDAGGETTAPPEAELTFAEGTTMAALAEAGTITIGTKFDQPLFGLWDPPARPRASTSRSARSSPPSSASPKTSIEWTEAVSANREPFIQNGEVDIVIATYTINDKRKEVVSFAGPYYLAGQSILVLADNEDIESEDDLVGSAGLLGDRLDARRRTSRRSAPRSLLTDTYSQLPRSRCATARVVAVSTDNVILAGLAAQNEGEFKVVGEPFTEEPYGIGLALDDTEFRTWINDVLEAVVRGRPLRGRPGTPRPAPFCRTSSRRQSTATDRSDAPGRPMPARGIHPLTTTRSTRGGARWNSCPR